MTAATLVSATGALLLLAAAATFLAVSWDTLGLTARVATVGTGTAGAIVGGARLRRTLPAVGAVIFHLGALLLPVDALGLALQLDVGLAGTWIAVGATTLVTLPVAAHAGRSRVLAGAALLGVPILATGLGLAGAAPAPLATAAAALLLLTVVRADRGTRDPEAGEPQVVLSLAAPSLAVVAVVGPLLVAAASAVATAAGASPLRAAATAGWLPATWSQAAFAGTVAVVVLAATAVLRRSARWAGAVPVLVALVAVTLLLPGDAPRLARLLPWPLLFLAVESTALAVRHDRALGAVVVRVATLTEALAALAIPTALWTVATATRDADALFSGGPAAFTPDLVLAAVAAVTAVAWVLAAARHVTSGRTAPEDHAADTVPGIVAGTTTAALAVATAAAIAASAALTFLAPASGLGLVVCLVAVAATAAVRGGQDRGLIASVAALALAGPFLAGTWNVAIASGRVPTHIGEVALALGAAVVAGALALRLVRHGGVGEGPAATVVLLPAIVGVVLVAGWAVESGFGSGAGVTVVVGLLLACARPVAVDGDVTPAAAALWGLAATIALLVEPARASGLAAAALAAPAAALVAIVLAAEGVRRSRTWLLVAAGPVLVRAVAGAVFAATASRPATGVALLALTVAAALVAVVDRDRWLPGVVTATVAVVPAFELLSLSPAALAWGTVGVGVAVIAGGLLTRQTLVAHLGGIVGTVGVWQLLDLAGVTAADLWLLAPALQLWLVGLPARRAGRVSSWVADVPPLVLVVLPALIDRLEGGSGWHAALAGTAAVVAVLGGGAGRHGGPLVVGVVGLVAVVLVETLAVVAAVPTWAWLTAGGVVLVGAGALIERTGGAPVATVRRLADVVAERFD